MEGLLDSMSKYLDLDLDLHLEDLEYTSRYLVLDLIWWAGVPELGGFPKLGTPLEFGECKNCFLNTLFH